MINNLAVLFSLVAVGYVVFKAVVLDKTMPWFGQRITVRPPVKRR